MTGADVLAVPLAGGGVPAPAPPTAAPGPAGRPWPVAVAATVRQVYRNAGRVVNQRAVTRVARAVPRTLGFVGSAVVRGEIADSLPTPSISLALAGQVAIDEALLAMAMAPGRFPLRSDVERVAGELADARALYTRRGWLADPRRYHREPPPLAPGDVRTSRGWALGLPYERLTWESGFSPRRGEPGRDRWEAFGANHTAAAHVVRHPDGPRPWVVCIHGFCMGTPFMDFAGLQTAMLHRELGCNVAVAVLPLHGVRKATPVSGEPFLSFELMNAVHGLTQAVWDLRRLVGWVRDQGATSVGVYGVSLGAYVTSLLAAVEPGLGAVVAGIPVVDLPALFHGHSPHDVRARAVEHRVMGGTAEAVYRTVSPLAMTPLVPHDRRFVFAGYGDRLATADQAVRLWEHWDRPAIRWYPGGHVGYLWSGQVSAFLRDSLASAGLDTRSSALAG